MSKLDFNLEKATIQNLAADLMKKYVTFLKIDQNDEKTKKKTKTGVIDRQSESDLDSIRNSSKSFFSEKFGYSWKVKF